MCGRYTLTSPDQILSAFDQVLDEKPRPGSIPIPRFNVAPTDVMPVILGDKEGRRLRTLRWGLVPHWADSASIGSRMINARVETAADKPAFRAALRRRRCLVITDGFYEWQTTASGKKQPMRITVGDGLFAFAGLWSQWETPEGEWLRTFTILTTRPNELMRPIHDRMPVILRPEHYDAWLAPGPVEELERIVEPYAADAMHAYPVGDAVGNVANDLPALVEEVEPPRGWEQVELFGDD